MQIKQVQTITLAQQITCRITTIPEVMEEMLEVSKRQLKTLGK